MRSPAREHAYATGRRVAALVLAALVALVVAPGANAGTDFLGQAGHFSYLKDDYFINGGAELDSGPECAVRVVGGGVYQTLDAHLGALLRTSPGDYDDANMRFDDGWIAGVKTFVDQQIYNLAVCMDRIPAAGGLRYPDGHAGVPALSGVGLKVGCPRGSSVVGGGGGFPGAPEFTRLVASKPFDGRDDGSQPDDGWQVRGTNLDTAGHRIDVNAICTTERRGKLVYRQKSTGRLPAGSNGFVRVRCPDDRFAVAGGGSQNGTIGAETWLNTLYPLDDGSPPDGPDDGWQAWDHSDKARDLTVYAVCWR